MTQEIEKYVLERLWSWNMQQGTKHAFNLPNSLFKDLDDHNLTYFQAKDAVVKPNVGRQKLSPQQLASIKATGTFEVRVPDLEQPYVWKLSSWVIRGHQSIVKSYISGMGTSFSLFYNINLLDIWLGLKKFKTFFRELAMLLVGLHSINVPTQQQILTMLEKQRQKQLILNHSGELDFSLSIYLRQLKFLEQQSKDIATRVSEFNEDRLERANQLSEIQKLYLQNWK